MNIKTDTMQKRKKLEDYLVEARKIVTEIFPWDLKDYLDQGNKPILLDVREPYEFEKMRIAGSVCVPRGILENAVDPGFTDTRDWLVNSRALEIILICRAGNRSLLAAKTLYEMGFENVKSLRTGVRGWSDSELPLVDNNGRSISLEESEAYFYAKKNSN